MICAAHAPQAGTYMPGAGLPPKPCGDGHPSECAPPQWPPPPPTGSAGSIKVPRGGLHPSSSSRPMPQTQAWGESGMPLPPPPPPRTSQREGASPGSALQQTSQSLKGLESGGRESKQNLVTAWAVTGRPPEEPPPPPQRPSSVGPAARPTRSEPAGGQAGVRRFVSGPPPRQSPRGRAGESAQDQSVPLALPNGGYNRHAASAQCLQPEKRTVGATKELRAGGPLLGCGGNSVGDDGIKGFLQGLDLGNWTTCLTNHNMSVGATQERISSGGQRPRPEATPSRGPRPAAPGRWI